MQTKRTLRVHLTTKVLDQSWQQDLSSLPDPPAPGTDAEEVDAATKQLEEGKGVPRFELGIGGELLGAAEGDERRFGAFVRRVVVETDRDPGQFDLVGPIDVSPTVPLCSHDQSGELTRGTARSGSAHKRACPPACPA